MSMTTCRNTLYKSVTTTTINFPKYFFLNQKMRNAEPPFEHRFRKKLCNNMKIQGFFTSI